MQTKKKNINKFVHFFILKNVSSCDCGTLTIKLAYHEEVKSSVKIIGQGKLGILFSASDSIFNLLMFNYIDYCDTQ